MWICQCGEQIDDQYKFCWKCGGKDPAKEPITIECPHCKIGLTYLGMKRFYEGESLAPVLLGGLGELFVNREHLNLYACARCGYVEFFLEGVGKDMRPKKSLQDTSPGDKQSPVSK